MGLVNSALQIGRSAISSYQSALSVIGNNIANAADPDYTRQRAVLNPVIGAPLSEGIRPGGGVALTSLQRIINEGLESRLRQAIGNAEASGIESSILSQIETSLNELTDIDLSSLVNTMLNAFRDVQNNPTDIGLRSVAIGNADALAGALRTRRSDLESMIEGINDQLIATTTQANELSQQIADLNIEIVAAEANGQTASALRDSRDAVLRELGTIIEITTRPQDSGAVNVFVGNETLIQLGGSRGLTTTSVVDGEFVRYEVRFADNNGQVEVRGGQMAGLLSARDGSIVEIIGQLDQLAAGLIASLNEIHTNGQGLEGFSSSTGTYGVTDPDIALATAASGLVFTPKNGSFFIAVTDTTSGLTSAERIDIDGTTTLNDLVTQINTKHPSLTATVVTGNKLSVTAEAGFTFSFGHDGAANWDDTSNVLTALGVNTLFEGKDATDIQINTMVAARPELLAASSVNIGGDGVNAGQLAGAGEVAHATLDNMTLFDFYQQMIANLGVDTASALAKSESADGVRAALAQQRASISGVNLDEEAVELLKYERAFQGSARFISIVDQLIAEMLNIAR